MPLAAAPSVCCTNSPRLRWQPLCSIFTLCSAFKVPLGPGWVGTFDVPPFQFGAGPFQRLIMLTSCKGGNLPLGRPDTPGLSLVAVIC